MLQVYSNNITVSANSPIPLNNVSYKKGCTAVLSGASSIALNKCGVYNVTLDSSSATDATVQLYVNGVAKAEAISTGTNAGFTTFVPVSQNNTNCPCTIPTVLQFVSEDATTFDNINVTISKMV
jgi:hypothetical protein